MVKNDNKKLSKEIMLLFVLRANKINVKCNFFFRNVQNEPFDHSFLKTHENVYDKQSILTYFTEVFNFQNQFFFVNLTGNL